MTDPQFEICLPFTLKEEGGNSNDPHDPGGRTHKGIIQREYDAFRQSKGLPLQTDYAMSDDEVKEIYYTKYWLPYCPRLKPGLNLSFFDNSVNEGPHRAIVLLQRALKIKDDGVWGPQIQNSIQSITDLKKTIGDYTAARLRFYQSLSTFKYFGTGWTRRCNEIEAASLNMVSTAPPTG